MSINTSLVKFLCIFQLGTLKITISTLKSAIFLDHFQMWHLRLGVSLLTPIHFRVPSLIFDPLVAKYLAENGVSGTLKKKLFAQFISYLAFTLMGWVSWPLYILVFLVSFLKNSHLCSTWLQNRNLYWIFLDEVGCDQSGGVLSPLIWAQLVLITVQRVDAL